jgi:phage terminase large subunit
LSAELDRLTGAQAAISAKARRARGRQGRRAYPSLELRDQPVRFARVALGFEPWDRQAEWMDELAPEGAGASIATGHKTGKSSGAAATCLWFWGTRRRARVVLMAPKIEHIEVVLWPEIRRLYLAAGRCADCQAKTIENPTKPPEPCDFCSPLGAPGWIGQDPTKGLRAPDGREIFAYTARKPDAIGGLSGPEMLFVFDEASGIDDAVFEAMKGNEAGGVRKLLLGNPLRTTGEFFDSHHNGKRFYTYTARISSEDTPNARSGEKLVPGLATREWCDKRAEEWGRDSVLWRVRVGGEFPRYEEGQLVSLDVLEAAEIRWESTPAAGRLRIGVDVAFTGDDAAIAVRRGQKMIEVTSLNGLDEDALAAHVIGAARAHRREHEPLPVVLYDGNGPGARLGKALQSYVGEIEALSILGTARPRRPREYLQLRDEIAFNFAAWLRAGGALPVDGKLEGEIAATKASDAGGGRRKVISNDDLKKTLKRSPDRRNACELAVWEPTLFSEGEGEGAAAAQGTAEGDDGAGPGDWAYSSGVGIDPYGGGSANPYGGLS